MPTHSITCAKALTYAGALPFIAAALLHVLMPMVMPYHLDVIWAVGTYAAVIASFLCGIHWALALLRGDRFSFYLLISSNLIALAAWASLLVPHAFIELSIQALCFMYLLALDRKLYTHSLYPQWYYHLRGNVTAIVLVCLCLLMVPS
jgi:hypothetical protein